MMTIETLNAAQPDHTISQRGEDAEQDRLIEHAVELARSNDSSQLADRFRVAQSHVAGRGAHILDWQPGDNVVIVYEML